MLIQSLQQVLYYLLFYDSPTRRQVSSQQLENNRNYPNLNKGACHFNQWNFQNEKHLKNKSHFYFLKWKIHTKLFKILSNPNCKLMQIDYKSRNTRLCRLQVFFLVDIKWQIHFKIIKKYPDITCTVYTFRIHEVSLN